MSVNPSLLEIPSEIETERLVFRRSDSCYADELYAMQHDSRENFSKWYGGTLANKNATKEDIREYILNSISNWYRRSSFEFLVFDKESNKMIGVSSLHHVDWSVPKGRIGYLVADSATGKGYATEMANVMTQYAFKCLEFLRLEIRASNKNPASGKVAQKLGYEFLSIFKNNKRSADGDLWDLEIHARLNDDKLPALETKWR